MMSKPYPFEAMSRVYDDIRRAATRRLRVAGSDPDGDSRAKAAEPGDGAGWRPAAAASEPPRAAERALAQVDPELGQQLDALQFSLNALEDRLQHQDPWPADEDPGAQTTVPARTEWVERLAQVEVAVHALEDQFAGAEDALASEPRATARERPAVDPLMIRIDALRQRLDRANQRQNIQFGILLAAVLWIYAC